MTVVKSRFDCPLQQKLRNQILISTHKLTEPLGWDPSRSACGNRGRVREGEGRRKVVSAIAPEGVLSSLPRFVPLSPATVRDSTYCDVTTA